MASARAYIEPAPATLFPPFSAHLPLAATFRCASQLFLTSSSLQSYLNQYVRSRKGWKGASMVYPFILEATIKSTSSSRDLEKVVLSVTERFFVITFRVRHMISLSNTRPSCISFQVSQSLPSVVLLDVEASNVSLGSSMRKLAVS